MSKKLLQIKPLYDAFHEYAKVYSNKGADYSVTDLIKAPRIVRLFKRYSKQIKREVDIVSQLGSFRGTAIHEQFRKLLWKAVQKSGTDDYMIETRLWDRINGRRISGAIDVLYQTSLYDFKTTSVWKKIYGDTMEWENQLNLYAFLLFIINQTVKELGVIAWYQDFDKMKAMNDKEYPKLPMELIPIELWDTEDQKNYMFDCIDRHKACELLPDAELPLCTADDQWAKEDSWAIYKLTKAGKLPGRASRVLKSELEANKYVGAKKGYQIVFRPGARVRCESWCDVSPWCSQYKEYMEGK